MGNAMSENFKTYTNEHYYAPDGKFKMEVAREAYFEMMRYFQYPIPERFYTDDFWVKDFNIGNFVESGLAGIFWISSEEYNISGHEMFLLPNQSVPEHWHVGTEITGPKLEAWHVRNGEIYTYSEGVASADVENTIPSSHKECTVAKKVQRVKPGEVAILSGAGERHWMRAGAEGAIVTEYATHHDHEGLRFSHPDGKFFLD
jgi:D-lyxose ketol-isomerase